MKRIFGETGNGSEQKRQKDTKAYSPTETSTGHSFDYARNASQMNTPGSTSDTRPRTRHSNPEGRSWLQRPDDLVLGVQLGKINSDQSALLRSYAHTYNTGQSDQLGYPSELSGAIRWLGHYLQLKEDGSDHTAYEKHALAAARATKNYLANHQGEITNSSMLNELQENFGS